MRSISGQQSKVLSGRDRSVFVRVKINRAGFSGSDWVDLTDLEGRNWIKSVKISASVDNNVSTATVGLTREVFQYNLSPFDSDSKLNASGTIADINNPIKIEAATMPIGTQSVADSDYVLLFHGLVDSVDFAPANIALKCSDMMGLLVSTFIETIREYGADSSAGGVSMPPVLQAIVDDNINTAAGIGPYTTGSPLKIFSINGTSLANAFPVGDWPTFNIVTYLQQKQTVFAALKAVVDLIGYDLRWGWHNGTGEFQFFFKTIDRGSPTSTKTFTSDDYYNFTTLSISTKDVRNVVKVLYGPAAADKTYGADNRLSVTVDNSASITKYGRRYMQIAEATNSAIDTNGEATVFANAALDDMKEPTANVAVDIPFFFAVDLNDYYTFSADNESRFSTNQSFAVTSYQHSFTDKGAFTSLRLRGKPSGGAKRWLQKESRPGVPVSKAADEDNTPADATGVTAVPTIGGMTVSWTDPTKEEPSPLNWEHTEVHVSAASGFTPSNSTLKEFARKNSASITDLTPGEARYVKVLHRDKKGFISAAGSATEVSTTTQTVGPYHMNPDWRFGVVVQNGNFNISTLSQATTPPDFWSASVGDWGSSEEIYFKSASGFVASGSQSMWFKANSTASRTLLTEKFPISYLETYINRVRYQISATQAGNTLSTTIYWWKYDKTASSTASSSGVSVDLNAVEIDTWNEATKAVVPPFDARFASLATVVNPAGGTQDVYVDSVTLNACPVAASVGLGAGGTQSIAKTGTVFAANNSAEPGQLNFGSAWDTGNYRFQAPHTGVYSFFVSGDLGSLPSGEVWWADLQVDDDSSFGSSSSLNKIYSPQSDGTNCRLNACFGVYQISADHYVRVVMDYDDTNGPYTLSNAKLSIWEVTNGLV